MQEVKTQEKIYLMAVSAASYIVLDLPVRLISNLPPYAGIKSFLPFMLGIFFGCYGVIGACSGAIIISLALMTPVNMALYECYCIIITGMGIWYGWHYLSRTHRIFFKKPKSYVRYILLVFILSCFTLDFNTGLIYFLAGVFIGIPVNILFGSLLCVIQIIPSWCKLSDESDFILDKDPGSIDTANEILEEAALRRGIKMNRVFEIQSCIEEIALRVFKNDPEAKIYVSVVFSDVTSARMNYAGDKYNPLKIAKDEDELDVAGLKIFRHRALRAMFNYWDGVNKVHAVV